MRRPNLYWILTIFLVFVLQVLIAPRIAPFGVVPNFFLLGTIFFAIRGGPVIGELVGFIFGLFSDVISISLFGSQTFMMTLIGYLVGRLERQVDEEKLSAQMVLVFLMSVLNGLGLFFLEALFAGAALRFRDKSAVLVPLYSTLISPVLFWVLTRWTAIFQRGDLRLNRL